MSKPVQISPDEYRELIPVLLHTPAADWAVRSAVDTGNTDLLLDYYRTARPDANSPFVKCLIKAGAADMLIPELASRLYAAVPLHGASAASTDPDTRARAISRDEAVRDLRRLAGRGVDLQAALPDMVSLLGDITHGLSIARAIGESPGGEDCLLDRIDLAGRITGATLNALAGLRHVAEPSTATFDVIHTALINHNSQCRISACNTIGALAGKTKIPDDLLEELGTRARDDADSSVCVKARNVLRAAAGLPDISRDLRTAPGGFVPTNVVSGTGSDTPPDILGPGDD